MRIGVFGDSYAEKTSNSSAWWRRFEIDHGHQVTSFGTGGSSILYSARLLQKHNNEFDFNIWCLTTPGRFSIPIPGTDTIFHSTNYMNTQGELTKNQDTRYKNLLDFCQGYLKFVFDWEDETLIGKSLAHYFSSIIPNLMIIPCFNVPIDNGFNLFTVCEMEINQIFPGQKVWEIYKKYKDIRTCHLSATNNKILSDSIASNLRPGIFHQDYKKFNFDNINFNDTLELL